MTVSGVVVVYHTDRSYWWPGVTLGAQDWFSSIIALRSPLGAVARVTDIALVPLCAWSVMAKVNSSSPQPERSQQIGKSPVTASRSPLTSRFADA